MSEIDTRRSSAVVAPSAAASSPTPRAVSSPASGLGAAAALWLFYAVIVLEILFMISPAALYFYSAYGPGLGLLHRSRATAWLTQFFLPHFSQTTSVLLAVQKPLAAFLVIGGALGFALGFGQIYWAKLRRAGAVSGGLYRFVRHPQYTSLAVLGLGTLLLWPRFLSLGMYATMLCLYAWLARREESICLERYGDAYRRYLAGTGRFLPRWRAAGSDPSPPRRHVVVGLARGAAVVAVALAAGFVLRDYSLIHVSGAYEERQAILSPAAMSPEELRSAYALAVSDPGSRSRLRAGEPLLVYVLPESWHLADLPAEPFRPGSGGHETPRDFDRTKLKVLLTRPRTHAEQPSGLDIVRTAYGREPLALVHVDTSTGEVIAVDTPPPHVLWGDIPTPMF